MTFEQVAELIDDELLAGYTHAQAHILIVLAHSERVAGHRIGGKPTRGGAYISERTLAKYAHASRNTVRETLALASERGLIVAEGVTQYRTERYRFALGRTGPLPAPVLDAGSVTPRADDGETGSLPETELAHSLTRTGSESEPESVGVRTTDRTARRRRAPTAARGDGYRITEENVRTIFDAWRYLLRYGRRVTLTKHRRDVICHALRARRGTVDEIREALANVAATVIGREDERITDLPHILHRDRLAVAIADKIDDEWTHSPHDDDGAY